MFHLNNWPNWQTDAPSINWEIETTLKCVPEITRINFCDSNKDGDYEQVFKVVGTQ